MSQQTYYNNDQTEYRTFSALIAHDRLSPCPKSSPGHAANHHGPTTSAEAPKCCEKENIRAEWRGGLAPWQAKLIRHHIDQNIDKKIKIDDLASLVKLSKSHFARAFRKSHGISPYGYVLSQRVKVAMERMLVEGVPLGQVALELGCTDQAHLSRVFRRITGTTPSAWRAKQLRR